MEENRSPIAAMLVAAVRQDPALPTDWAATDTDLVLRASLEHRCAPALYLWLRDQEDVPVGLLDRLRAAHRDQAVRHLRRLAELSWLGDVLDTAQVSWLVVKGPVLAEQLWPRSDMRQYADLDVVVDRSQFGEALAVLETAGAILVDRNWPMIHRTMRAELTLRLPHGTALDLHWHVVNERRDRRMFRFPMEEMLARGVPAGLEGLSARTLDPVDTVLHLAYHTARSGAHRLVWLKDFALAVQAPGVASGDLQERASAYGCALVLDVVSRRCEAVLGELPGQRTVGSRRSWTHVTDWVDRLRPAPGLPDTGLSGQIAFKSCRDTTAHTLAALGRSALRSRAPREPTDANPLHEAHGVEAARTAYVTALREPGAL